MLVADWYIILFQIRAFGAEGMIEEMMRYLNVAENVLLTMDPYQKSDLYGIALNFLVKAKEVCVNSWLHCSAIMKSPLNLPDTAVNVLPNLFFSGLQTGKAIRIFKIMRSCSLPSNVAIYTIMIECMELLPCPKSSYALLSLMLRDGFCPTVVTFTSLLKVSLANV